MQRCAPVNRAIAGEQTQRISRTLTLGGMPGSHLYRRPGLPIVICSVNSPPLVPLERDSLACSPSAPNTVTDYLHRRGRP